MLKRTAGLAALLLLIACGQEAAIETPMDTAPEAAPVGEPRFVFLTPEEAAAALTAEDRFTRNLQPREIGIRAQEPGASKAQMDAVYAGDTMAFSEEQKARLEAAIEASRPALDAIAPHLPEKVGLALAGTDVAGGLPHTRGTTIFFAGGGLPDTDEALQSLFLHELHHVLSRANRDRHDDYFALIGYEPCEIVFPESLREIRLTNPDAPTYDHYVPTPEEEADGVVPFLYATREYEPGSDTRLPDYFGFGLARVEMQDGVCTVMAGNVDDLVPPNAVPSFAQAIGRNTGYVIHPEETLADNFVLWAMGKEGMPDPEIPAAIGAFWTETPPAP
jgi:hypothetical protein